MSHLRQGGASVYGKTNLDEFGMGSHSTNSFLGSVKNILPFNSYSAGGSSGGSAVAVASGQWPIALGTDTGGSVRLPAAYTGIIGFKPSYGAISRWGVIPYANSMDTVGIMASHTKPLRQTFQWARQHDARDPTSLSEEAWARLTTRRKEARGEEIRKRAALGEKIAYGNKIGPGTRIGVPLEYNIAELELGIRQAWKDCLEMLQDAGCTIVPISLPNTEHALSAYYVLAPAEAASNLSKYDGVRYGSREGSTDGAGDVLYSKTRGEGFGDEVKRRILLGSYTLSAEAVDNYFLKAQKVRRLVQRDFDRAFAAPNPLRPAEQFDLSEMDASIEMSDKLGPTQVDFIVCPTAPTLPPTLEDVSKQTPVDSYMNDVFTVPASLAGLPAISIPFPISEEFRNEGKPAFAGMQIIGQYSSDYPVIKMGEVLMKKGGPIRPEKASGLLIVAMRGISREGQNLRRTERLERKARKLEKSSASSIISGGTLEKSPPIRKIFPHFPSLQAEMRAEIQAQKKAKMEHKLRMLESERLEMRVEELEGKELRGKEQVPSRKVFIRRFRKNLIRKYVSSNVGNSLEPVDGDLFLRSSKNEGYRVGTDRPARNGPHNEEITDYVEIPVEEKIRRVYLVQPKERLPLTENEISNTFEDAWAKWEEQMSPSPP